MNGFIQQQPIKIDMRYMIVDPREMEDVSKYVVALFPTIESAQKIYGMFDDPELILKGITNRDMI